MLIFIIFLHSLHFVYITTSEKDKLGVQIAGHWTKSFSSDNEVLLTPPTKVVLNSG